MVQLTTFTNSAFDNITRTIPTLADQCQFKSGIETGFKLCLLCVITMTHQL